MGNADQHPKEDLMQPTLTGLLVFMIASESGNPYTYRHAVNVAELAVMFGRSLSLDAQLIESIRIGSLLHDIGKLSVPNEVLLKPGKLIAEELSQIQCHPVNGHQIVGPLDLTATMRHIILFHHERWDGTGYPSGLKGKEIPLAGRIAAVADVFDALTTERSYKSAWSVDRAFEHIREEAGRQFDPACVAAFEKCRDSVVEVMRICPDPEQSEREVA